MPCRKGICEHDHPSAALGTARTIRPGVAVTSAPDQGSIGRLGPFRHRAFAVYWTGGVLSNIGTWLHAIASSIFVYQLTGSVLAVGILNFVGFLPTLLLSVVGGSISDRFDRRKVVIWTHVASALLTVPLAAMTFAGMVAEWHLIVVSFGLNAGWAIAKPSLMAMLPALVPRDEVTDAVGLNALQFILGQIIGPTIAALVIATAGPAWAFSINAITFLGPILGMVYLQRRGLGGPAPTSLVADEAPARPSASAFVRERPWVLALLAGVIACTAPLEMVSSLAPALVVEGLAEPESAAGLIVAAMNIGAALALLVFVPLRKRGWSEPMAAIGLGLQAIGLACTSIADGLPMAAASVGLVGFGFSLCFPILTGTLQAEVPDAVRGRVMGFHQMAHLGNRPFAALAAGALGATVGPQPAIIAGAILAPIGLIMSRRAWDALRRSRIQERSTVSALERSAS
jgi:MFS family permease